MSLTLWHRNPILLTCYTEVQLTTFATVSLLQGCAPRGWTFASGLQSSVSVDFMIHVYLSILTQKIHPLETIILHETYSKRYWLARKAYSNRIRYTAIRGTLPLSFTCFLTTLACVVWWISKGRPRARIDSLRIVVVILRQTIHIKHTEL